MFIFSVLSVTLMGTAPITHWTGDWVGPTDCLDALAKIKLLYIRFEVFYGGDYEEWRLL
jgi:hypothetical protein